MLGFWSRRRPHDVTVGESGFTMLAEHRSGDEGPRNQAAACRPQKQALRKAMQAYPLAAKPTTRPAKLAAHLHAWPSARCRTGCTVVLPLAAQLAPQRPLPIWLHIWLHNSFGRQRVAQTSERKKIPFLYKNSYIASRSDFTAG